nr:MAG TPA: hypothetical protein [Caudoviricetes sp.]
MLQSTRILLQLYASKMPRAEEDNPPGAGHFVV